MMSLKMNVTDDPGCRITLRTSTDYATNSNQLNVSVMRNLKTFPMMLAVIAAAVVAACQSAPQVPEYNGAMLFQGYCASCHGPAGLGDGPVAPQLTVLLENLQTIQARNNGVFPRQSIEEMIEGTSLRIAHGTPNMPVWGWAFYTAERRMGESAPQEFATARIDALVDYLEGIQTNQ